VKRTSFTDSYECAADMMTLVHYRPCWNLYSQTVKI